jgi:glycosyltransferase involved in cell wall biosynthesis
VSERRVLQVLGRSSGGIARHVAQLVKALDGQDGLRVDVAAHPNLPIEMPKEVLPVIIPSGPIAGHVGAIRKLRTLIAEGGYHVVHAHGLRATLDVALARRGLSVCVLSTIHNLVRPEVKGPVQAFFFRFAEPLAVRLSDHTFAVCEDIAKRLRADARTADKVEVLYLGIGKRPRVKRKADVIRRELGVSGSRRLIVTASRLSAQKALHVMLHALARLPPGIILCILGEGPLEKDLKSLAESLRVLSRVRFLGFRSDVVDYIAAAEVFCLSSNWEACPLAIQEAILLGTPVVATDVGGLRELLQDRRSGRLVNRGDAPALAQAIQELLSSEDLAKRYADRARRDLHERFSTDKMLRRLRAAYFGTEVAA